MNLTTKLKESRFDFIHQSQSVFKSLMMALAFPGKINKLNSLNLAINNEKYNFVLQCLLTLLDLETSFHVMGDSADFESEAIQYLKINTGCESTNLDDADFVLCLSGTTNGLFSRLKSGTLSQPNKSSTVFYFVDSINETPNSNSRELILSGPGIKDEKQIFLTGIPVEEIQAWINNRGNYPLGCDIYCVSAHGDIIGIPRSSNIILKNT